MKRMVMALILVAAMFSIAHGSKMVRNSERINKVREQRAAQAVEEQRMSELAAELPKESEQDLLAIVADLQKRVKELEARVAKLEAAKTEARE